MYQEAEVSSKCSSNQLWINLAERDLFLRRSSSERDPGNAMAAQMFGTELTNKLIRSLWGGDRKIKPQV
ncbi:MAG TPA: hypothetical protein V6C95_00330 [Coleofasciculaceae cyanobacterium]